MRMAILNGHWRKLALLALLALLAGCNPATLRLPDRPSLPVVLRPPKPPVPRPAAARYVSPEPSVESIVPRKPNLSSAPIAVAPIKGDHDPMDLRVGLIKALVKGGLRVRDFDSAGRILVGYRRGGAGTSTDLYGYYTDVMRAAPATVGGFVVWPEIVAFSQRQVEAGGEPVFEPQEVETWKTELSGYEAQRTSRLEQLNADLERYRREFAAALQQYAVERNFLQELNDGKEGPKERGTYQSVVDETERAAERLANARSTGLDEVMAATQRRPETLELAVGRVRLTVCDARSGDVVGVHEVQVEASSVSSLSQRLVELSAKALGVKR